MEAFQFISVQLNRYLKKCTLSTVQSTIFNFSISQLWSNWPPKKAVHQNHLMFLIKTKKKDIFKSSTCCLQTPGMQGLSMWTYQGNTQTELNTKATKPCSSVCAWKLGSWKLIVLTLVFLVKISCICCVLSVDLVVFLPESLKTKMLCKHNFYFRLN